MYILFFERFNIFEYVFALNNSRIQNKNFILQSFSKRYRLLPKLNLQDNIRNLNGHEPLFK